MKQIETIETITPNVDETLYYIAQTRLKINEIIEALNSLTEKKLPVECEHVYEEFEIEKGLYSHECIKCGKPKKTTMTNEKELREEFDEKFGEVRIDGKPLRLSTTGQFIADFFISKFHSHTQEVVEKAQEAIDQERQFMMNVLDGIDIADVQMQNEGGGTKAIRFALSSRVKPNLSALLKEDNNK